MSTEPETTEDTEPGTPDAEPGTPDAGAEAATAPEEAATPPEEADDDPGADDAGAEGSSTEDSSAADGDAGAGELSEAEAELQAQRIERERIERRKAEKKGPIESGAKLSGTAADLLAAVRAVESGEKPARTVFSEPAAPRRPAPEPVRRPQPAPAEAAPVAPAPVPAQTVAVETVAAVGRVLADGGAPEALAPQAAAVLGEGAAEALREDPWQLLRVASVRPEHADSFARALLGPECAPGDERRGRALTGWLLEQAAVAGHTALDVAALTAALGQRGVPDPDAALQDALAEGEALAFQDALDEQPTPPPWRRARRSPSVRCACWSAWSGMRSPRRASPTVSPGWSTPSPRTTGWTGRRPRHRHPAARPS